MVKCLMSAEMKFIKSKLSDVVQEINPAFYRPIDIQVQIGDSSELKEITGWKPEIDIDTCMEDLLNYWVKKLTPLKK